MVITFKTEELECAHCAAKMQDKILKLDGVKNATVSFLAQKITVEIEDDKAEGIGKKIADICQKIEPDCVVIY